MEDSVQLALPGQVTATSLLLPEALPYEQWEEIGRKLHFIEGAVQWWLGDWLRYGERTYGEMYSQALDATDKSYQTLANAVWVAEKFGFSRRRENLSFSHHVEVAALEPPEQDRWLDKAEVEGWTRATLRAAVSQEKRIGRLDASALPMGVFDVILADPPWPYDNQLTSWGPTSLHYATMGLDDIKALQVPAADNATLFLWTTNPFLKDALEVVSAWGFEYKTNIVWVKTNLHRPGSGFYVRGHHELLFICTKGNHVPGQTGKEPISSILEAPVREHSRKPIEAYEVIEAMYPASRYLELFARGAARPKWEVWGDESRN